MRVSEVNFEPGWLEEILEQAEREVQKWPEWMRLPEYRFKFAKVVDLYEHRLNLTIP